MMQRIIARPSHVKAEKLWAIPILQILPHHLSSPKAPVMFISHISSIFLTRSINMLRFRPDLRMLSVKKQELDVLISKLKNLSNLWKLWDRNHAYLLNFTVDELFELLGNIAEIILLVHKGLDVGEGCIAWLPPPGKDRQALTVYLAPDPNDKYPNARLDFEGFISIEELEATSKNPNTEEINKAETEVHISIGFNH